MKMTLMLVVIALLSVGTTIAVYLFSKNTRVVKYLPGLMSIGMAAYLMLIPPTQSTGFQDIGRILMGIMFLVWAAAGIICAVIIDARLRRKGE